MWEQLDSLQESLDISLTTKAHLDRSYLDLQARIHEAEKVLTAFYFDDAHYSQEDMPPRIRSASDRFRKFLRQFYEKEFQNWPVKRKLEKALWLDRRIAKIMKHDFDSLYEYCVDRNVELSESELFSTRQKNKPLLKSSTLENFWLDSEDDRMLSVFRNFDCRYDNKNIPHCYPLLPDAMPIDAGGKKSLLKNKKNDKVRQSRVIHAYAQASNAAQLDRQFAENGLLRAFINFEKSDQPGDIDPREARRERWIIIYCTLQTLARMTIEVPYLSFKTNVDYFLITRMEHLPPWKPNEKVFEEASLEQSHCWTYPRNWADTPYERPDRRMSAPNRAHSPAESRGRSSQASNTTNTSCRPLSPESHFSYDSNRNVLLSELDGARSGETSSGTLSPSGPGTPLTIPPALTDASTLTIGTARSSAALPQSHSSAFSSKFKALSGIDEFNNKPLPTRLETASPNRIKSGFRWDSRFPRPKR